MIKLRIRDAASIERAHYKYCKTIMQGKMNNCLPFLSNLLFEGGQVKDSFVRNIIIGKREHYFSHNNFLFLVVEFFKITEWFSKAKISSELKSKQFKNTKFNKQTVITEKTNELFSIVDNEGFQRLLNCSIAEFKAQVHVLAQTAWTIKHCGDIAQLVDTSLNDSKEVIMANIEYIFNYDEFCSGLSWGRKSLIRALDVDVCPYCNRQYITTLTLDNGDVKATADLDHYYLKKIYPYLGLSLYNFIPSCQICNSRHKHTKDFYEEPHVYPYENEFGSDAKFIIEDSTDIKLILGDSSDIKIGININPHSSIFSEINESYSTFKIKDLYQHHNKLVKELVLKKTFYNETKKDELKEWLSQMGIATSSDELMQMLYTNYIGYKDFNIKPLAKFTFDILEFLGEEIK